MNSDFTINEQRKFADEDFINSERIEEELLEEICSFEEDGAYDRVILYLKNKAQNMTVGFYLRRFICSKFAVRTEEDGKIIILKGIDKAGESAFFKVRNFDDENIDDSYLNDYVNFAKGLILKNETKVKPSELKNWLVKDTCEKNTFLKQIAFTFNFTIEECNDFFNKALAQRGFNFRDIKETIYYYCLRNNLTINEAKEILEKYDNIPVKQGIKNYMLTSTLNTKVDSIRNIKDFLVFLNNNRGSFTKFSHTEHDIFIRLYEDVRVLISMEEYFNAYDDEYVLGDIKSENKFVLVSRDLVEIKMFCREEDIDDKKRWEYRKINDSRLKDVFYNILTRDKVDKKFRYEKEITKKDIVFLNFYKIALLIDLIEQYQNMFFKFEISTKDLENLKESKNIVVERLRNLKKQGLRWFNIRKEIIDKDCGNVDVEEVENTIIMNRTLKEFKYSTNRFLVKCEMGKLYIPNKFDNLVISCIIHRSPLICFAEIIRKSFE